MKSNFARWNERILRPFGLALAAALALHITSETCQARPFDSPAGTWDFISYGGGQRGIAYLTFNDGGTNGGTFNGFALIAGHRVFPVPSDSGGRNPGGDERRGDLASTPTNAVGGDTNFVLVGFTPVSGPWQFDVRGRVIGAFNELVDVTSVATNFLANTNTETITNLNNPLESTNIVVVFTNSQAIYVTNYTWPSLDNFDYVFINTNVTIESISGEVTNSISFVGAVRPGRRFNLISSTSFGKTIFRGLPAVTSLINLDGSQWYGAKRQQRQRFTEFFDLHSFSTPNPFGTDFPGIGAFPNIYWTTNGIGPAYGFIGVAVISRQGRVGFVFNEDHGEDSFALRATSGTLINNKRITQGFTRGTILEPAGIRINYIATKQP